MSESAPSSSSAPSPSPDPAAPRPAPPTSLTETLRRRLDPRRDPGQPLVTFYDDASGERTELSVTTYANWVAKTAGVLVEDLDLGAGDRVRVDLPAHWLGPVFLGAAWLAGLEIVTGGVADLVVAGPGRPADPEPGPGASADPVMLLHCALLPFAVAAREPMPSGVLDFGTLWPSQPDAFLGVPGSADDPAYDGRDQAALLGRSGSPDRVLTDLPASSPAGLELFVDVLVGGGSLVLVAAPQPDPTDWSARATSERTDRVVRADRADRADQAAQPPRS